MVRRVAKLALFGALALHGCTDEAPSATSTQHASRLRIRLAVADLRAPAVTVYDVADREVVGRLAVDAPGAALVASQSGDTALAVPKNGGEVQVVGGGVAVIPHKDHIHIFKSPPAVLGSPVGGAGAAALSSAEGKWGIFFEGDQAGSAAAFAVSEAPWIQGTRVPVEVATRPAHRGVVVPFAGEYLVSRPPPAGGSDAVSIDFVAAGSSPQPLFECPGMSAAATAGIVAFGCASGIVLVGPDRVASPPVRLPDGFEPSELSAQIDQPFVLGRDLSGRVLGLELASRTASLLPIDGEACDAVLELSTAPRAVVLTSGGRVERFELATKKRLSSTAIAPSFACSDAERPHLAATPGRAWVTSPGTGEIIELDTDVGASVRKIAVGGVPGSIAVLGLEARNADLSVGTDKLTD